MFVCVCVYIYILAKNPPYTKLSSSCTYLFGFLCIIFVYNFIHFICLVHLDYYVLM